MKVKRLELKGFRGFDEIVLDFDVTPGRPTVFIGNNGVGKSSILDALAILLSYFVSLLGRNKQSPRKEKYAEIGRQSDYQDYKKNHESCELGISIESKNNTNYKWNIPSDGNYNLGELSKLVDSILDDQLNDITSIPIVLYYSVNRFIPDLYIDYGIENSPDYSKHPIDAYENSLVYYTPRSIENMIIPIPSSSIPGFDKKSPIQPKRKFVMEQKAILEQKAITFYSFFEWFKYFEDLENEQIRDDSTYKDKQLVAVRNSIYSIIPEFSDIRIRRDHLRMTVNKTIGDQVEELTINQLSDGEKCLLAMVGDIARRLAIANPGLDDPLQGEGIVLIDEIELHLHPQWQHRIIPRLTETFPNCQFIVTTHSPLVLGHVRPENIYILKSTSEGIKAYQPESSYGRDSNQILENIMETSERPQYIQEQLKELFRLLDQNDFIKAKQLRQELEADDMLGEPELIKAGVIMGWQEALD